jgi:hypothetical protein
MDLKDQLLEEALKLETRAKKLREAARIISSNGKAKPVGARTRSGHTRLKCQDRTCGRGFIGIKGSLYCSPAHGLRERRARAGEVKA